MANQSETWGAAPIEESPHAEILAVLRGHGDVFTGGPSREDEIAREWAEYGFCAATTDEWCAVGVWDAAVAAQLRDAGLSPQIAKTRAERLVESIRDCGGDPAETYTDGCPIYAVCNGDTSIDILLTGDH